MIIISATESFVSMITRKLDVVTLLQAHPHPHPQRGPHSKAKIPKAVTLQTSIGIVPYKPGLFVTFSRASEPIVTSNPNSVGKDPVTLVELIERS
jgi:hypothetical protein